MSQKLYYIFVIFTICHNITPLCRAQSTSFTFRYSTTWDEVPTDAVETPDGGYIVTAKQGDRNIYDYQTLLIRLSSTGDTLKTLRLWNASGNCYLYELAANDDSNYFAFGTRQESPGEMSIWVLKIDEDLNILWERTYTTGCSDLTIAIGFIDHNGNLIIYSDGDTGLVNFYDIMVYKLNQNGDSISARLYPSSSNQHVWSMIENPDLNSYSMMITGRYLINLGTAGQILSFDSALNIVNIDSLPARLIMYYDAMAIGQYIILSGMKVILILDSYEPANLLGILKLDSSHTILSSYNLGSMDPDTASYPGYIHNLDTVSSNEIYFGGTYNQDTHLFLSYFDSWILLAKFDSSLNLQWQKFYGGDMYYGLWGLRATSDGGCLLLGSTYDDQIQYNERDIIIIKVDSNGVITGSNKEEDIIVHEAILCPNPGSEYCIAILGVQHPEATLFFYDINGRLVLERPLYQYQTRIQTTLLPTGTYIFTFVANGKVIGTGKWIKK